MGLASNMANRKSRILSPLAEMMTSLSGNLKWNNNNKKQATQNIPEFIMREREREREREKERETSKHSL